MVCSEKSSICEEKRQYIIGQNNVRLFFHRTKLFVGQNIRHLQKNSLFLSDIVLSDKVYAMAKISQKKNHLILIFTYLGGIRWFAADHNNVLKWCLNRSHQARIAEELQSMSFGGKENKTYKCLRPHEISKEDKMVTKVVEVLQEEYLNPFSPLLGDELINISSGVPVADETADQILNLETKGKEQARAFLQDRLLTKKKRFHDPIPRNHVPSFQSHIIRITKDAKVKTVEANRNILGKLISLSAKYEKPIDLDIAMSYPLYHVPLSLANPDGSKKSTQKSKLMQIFDYPPETTSPNPPQNSVFIVDFIAQVRVLLTGANGTFEDFFNRFLGSIPGSYKRIDIVADTYRDFSIKTMERSSRGKSSKILIGSFKSRLPSDMSKFMMNNGNKNEMIQMMYEYIVINKHRILDDLSTNELYYSTDGKTYRLTHEDGGEFVNLSSDQEEADTKVFLFVKQASVEFSTASVCIRTAISEYARCIFRIKF